MKSPVTWIVGGFALLGVALAGLILRPTSDLATTSTPAPGPRSLVDAPAPDFTVTTLDGEPLALSDLRGRAVVLNFWATWCVPCRAEMPAFATFTPAHPDGPVILAVNADAESAEDVRAFLSEVGAENVLVGLDASQNARSRYAVPALPTTYFIDAAGAVRTVRFGEVTLEDLTDFAEFLRREDALSEP